MNKKILALLAVVNLLIPIPASAVWYNPATWTVAESVGNFFQAVYMFFYNISFVLFSTILFAVFFGMEIFIVYIYWRVIAFLYNNLMPLVKRGRAFFESVK
jgi:hypothetical protein